MKRSYRAYLYDEETDAIPRTTLNRWSDRLPEIADAAPEEYQNEDCGISSTEEEINNVLEENLSECNSNVTSPSMSPSTFRDDDTDNDNDFVIEDSRDPNNTWLIQPLYEGSESTVGDAVKDVLDYFFRNSLTKKALEELLRLLNTLLPHPNNIPKTKYFLSKLLNSIMPSHDRAIKKHRFCNQCSHYLGEWFLNPPILECDLCQSTDVDGMFVEYDIRCLLKDAFEVRGLHRYIDMYSQSKNYEDDLICDVTDSSEYKLMENVAIPGKYDLCLIWNVDGLPTANSSNGQLWPIQFQILNVPPKLRRLFQFVCGLWYSRVSKPDMSSFLKPFAAAMRDLYANGIDWQDERSGLTINSKVIAPIATLDCPARAAVQNIMQFNGANGCSFCEHPGETCHTGAGINHVYPPLPHDPPLRTKEAMISQASMAVNSESQQHIKGVKGASIVSTMPFFNVATGFVPDYMHAVLLGVVRMLLACWCDTKNSEKPFYIKKSLRDKIDEGLQQIKPPDWITRTPRPLKYRQYWKASELRAFLLFYSPILLKDTLPRPYYQHYLLLVRATQILLQSKIHTREIDFAEALLGLFVGDVKDLYGLEKCSFNVHQLTHIANFVRLWGPLWAWSAFPFEDGNGYLSKITHGPNKIDVEICNTLKIINALQILKQKCPTTKANPIPEPLGKPLKQSLDDDDISALQDIFPLQGAETANSSNVIDVENKHLIIYARIRIVNEVYTSELYQNQHKRSNSVIFWRNTSMFGIVKLFVAIDSSLYAIVRELAEERDPSKSITHVDTGTSFNRYLKPVRSTYCTHAVPVEAIEGKVLKVANYACLLPNIFELK